MATATPGPRNVSARARARPHTVSHASALAPRARTDHARGNRTRARNSARATTAPRGTPFARNGCLRRDRARSIPNRLAVRARACASAETV